MRDFRLSDNGRIGFGLLAIGVLLVVLSGIFTLVENEQKRIEGLGNAASLPTSQLRTLNNVLGSDFDTGRVTRSSAEDAVSLPSVLLTGGIFLAAAGGGLVIFARRSQARSKCPFCAEKVLRDALICKHCRRELPGR